MTVQALLFDVDGTLVRTNAAHVDAWLDAMNAFHYRVGRARIEAEIGKGGDLLVPTVLGRDAEALYGDALRRAHHEAFRARIEREGVSLIEGAEDILADARRCGLRTALATSSKLEDLKLLERLSGWHFTSCVDAVATAGDAPVSKPAPHIVEAACEKLGEDPLVCALVGDSLHDAEAARAAGVAFLGVTSGFADPAALTAAGARFVAPDLVHLRSSLVDALAAASHSHVRFDDAILAAMMDSALDAARAGLARGEVPIGAAIFDCDGRLLSAGHNRACEAGDITAHAAMDALRQLAARGVDLGEGGALVSTLEPCIMCLGAAMEAGIDVIVYGLAIAAKGGPPRLLSPLGPENPLPRMRGGVCAAEAYELFAESLQRPYVELLANKSAS
jgi:HAD superfamily hydrolase (TIGR01549 family)